MNRQRLVGWTLVGVSVVYILYFLKVRLFSGGVAIEKKEWVYFVLSFVGVMLGTINIRMAEMRARGEKPYFSLWPPKK
jgi:hypothetical protein